jgi:hypothetical protein
MKRLHSLAVSTAAIAFANVPAAKRVEPQLTAVAAVKMPERINKRGSISLYPFDGLANVGQAFGVKNKTAAQLSSIVSNANRKALTAKKDADGNTIFKTKEITAADGSKSVVPTTEPEMVATKHFFAHDVDAEYAKTLKGTPLEGSSVVIFRDT